MIQGFTADKEEGTVFGAIVYRDDTPESQVIRQLAAELDCPEDAIELEDIESLVRYQYGSTVYFTTETGL